jgi:hypothetical protein
MPAQGTELDAALAECPRIEQPQHHLGIAQNINPATPVLLPSPPRIR